MLWVGLQQSHEDREGNWLYDKDTLQDIVQTHIHETVIFGFQALIFLNLLNQKMHILSDFVDFHLSLFFDNIQFFIEKIN